MRVYHITAECYPIAKVGGLGDVLGALPKYQKEEGHKASVIMPHYDSKFSQKNKFQSVHKGIAKVSSKSIHFQVLKLKKNTLDKDVFFVDIPELLHTKNVYSNDDTFRFIAFQIATLNWIVKLKERPYIVHCHDHHTGLIPFMILYACDYKELKSIPTVFTIHNAQYQGGFSHDKRDLIPEFNDDLSGFLDWNNCINPLAVAIKCAWKVTTVSNSYMEELKQKANGLEGLLTHESEKCSGILNGIDHEVWNPETDTYLIRNYKLTRVISGKKANKQWLCNTYNLDPQLPLFIFIGRLVYEKGADVLANVFDTTLIDKKKSILLLGSGDSKVEDDLKNLKAKHDGFFNTFIGYDERLSHIMYSGADFLIMPSRIEPCGLNQMYALRYGTIPIVHEIGGLKDTVIDVNNEGYGVVHKQFSETEIEKAIHRAQKIYQNTKQFRKLQKRVMTIDYSWEASAKKYIKLYNSIIKLK